MAAATNAEANVQEYGIVLAQESQVEIYHRREGGRYQETSVAVAGDTIQCRSLPAVRFRVAEMFGE